MLEKRFPVPTRLHWEEGILESSTTFMFTFSPLSSDNRLNELLTVQTAEI